MIACTGYEGSTLCEMTVSDGSMAPARHMYVKHLAAALCISSGLSRDRSRRRMLGMSSPLKVAATGNDINGKLQKHYYYYRRKHSSFHIQGAHAFLKINLRPF